MKHAVAAAAKYARRRPQTMRTESTAQTSAEPSHSLSVSQPRERDRARRRRVTARLHTAPAREPARERDLESDMGSVSGGVLFADWRRNMTERYEGRNGRMKTQGEATRGGERVARRKWRGEGSGKPSVGGDGLCYCGDRRAERTSRCWRARGQYRRRGGRLRRWWKERTSSGARWLSDEGGGR